MCIQQYQKQLNSNNSIVIPSISLVHIHAFYDVVDCKSHS